MSPRLTRTTRLASLAAGVSAAVALTGCTALSGGSVAPVVVTVTPTVTVTPKAAPASPAPSTSASATADIKSDDVGKKFDLGKITEVKDVQGTKVVVLDRYRNLSIPSARLFAEGMTLEPHRREIFSGGSSQTYDLPVRPEATFTKMTCTDRNAPAATAASSLDELAGLQGRAAIVLVELDDQGWITKATSDPVCL